MPDGLGGAGIGAGGGAIAAAVAYALNQFFGSGKAIKLMEDRLTTIKQEFSGDLREIKSIVERTTGVLEKLYDWHNVADPDDPSGKLWYFSVSLRRLLDSLQIKITRLLDLLDNLVRRFEQYNTTTEKLITVVEALQRDLNTLGAMVANSEPRRH